MALSEIEKTMVTMFRTLKDDGKFDDKAVLAIFSMLKTDAEKQDLVEYMYACGEKNLTQEGIVKMACEIFNVYHPKEERK